MASLNSALTALCVRAQLLHSLFYDLDKLVAVTFHIHLLSDSFSSKYRLIKLAGVCLALEGLGSEPGFISAAEFHTLQPL